MKNQLFQIFPTISYFQLKKKKDNKKEGQKKEKRREEKETSGLFTWTLIAL